eukprot:8151027-Pyramimonas_sp.AAC.1
MDQVHARVKRSSEGGRGAFTVRSRGRLIDMFCEVLAFAVSRAPCSAGCQRVRPFRHRGARCQRLRPPWPR